MNIDQIILQMQSFKSWEDKYRFIIMLGKTLPSMDENDKKQAFEVKGCESQVWLNFQCIDEKYHFQADSDARIVKGLIALVLAAVEGKSKSEIAKVDFGQYFDKIQLLHHLSASRAEGVQAIVKAIKAI